MKPLRRLALCVFASALLAGPSAQAAGPANTALLDAQRQALAPLAIFDGQWRGEATVMQPDGKSLKLVQTERVGPMLDGTLRVVEGRGYLADGKLAFNAFAVISFSPQTGKVSMRSHAQGYAGEYPLELRADGFSWSIPAGPATISYTATLADGVWTEIGERLMPGQPPLRIYEMKLRRIAAASDWPAGGAVAPAVAP